MTLNPTVPWSRQGARNVAGVTYQVAVAAHILVQGRAGTLPITSVMPEGMEDVDCRCRDGSVLIVQAKERGDGASTLAVAAIADILEHALPALEATTSSCFVIATNAHLGNDLVFTGWQQSIQQAFSAVGVTSLTNALNATARPKHGALLPRSGIVALERQLSVPTTQTLSATYGIAPAVAALVYSLLVQDLGEVAAVQRTKTQQTAVSRQLSDLDALVEHVLSTVDVTQLDAAIRAGILESLDFTIASPMSQEQFLLGVDTAPSHVAANLDLERPKEDAEIARGIKEDGYVVIAGPSGCGKSALIWRSARNCNWVSRKARILRLTDADVPELVRWVRLQQPSPQAPVLLCSDNLGRGSTSGWTAAVAQLRGMAGVVLLGGARREDFHAALVATAPLVVEPTFSAALSQSIAATLKVRQITAVIDPDEAFAQSGGLLMEFLYLLLAGRRMQDVVTAQVHERLGADRATEREALRYVCFAHRVGLGVPAETLGELLGQPQDLSAALLRLKHEHLLTENENTEWIGLHELRSEVICDVLQLLPPPTEETTYAVLLAALPASSKPVLLQRYGYLSQAPIAALAETTREILARPDTSCQVAATLIDALRECESVRYAKSCIAVAQKISAQAELSIADRLTFAILMREKKFEMPRRVPALEALAEALPERPVSHVSQVLSQVGPARLVALTTGAPTIVATNLLAAMEGYVELSAALAGEIWAAHSAATLRLRLGILASLSRIAVLSAKQVERFAGSMQLRLDELVRNQPNGICASISRDAGDGVIATGEVLVPSEGGQAHSQAVTLAEEILAYLPEADIAEVITREPAGREYLLNGHPHNHKRIPRKNLPRATETRPQTEVLDAVARLLAARYWSERLRLEAEMAEQATVLLNQLPVRLLNRHDNAGRRSNWREQVFRFGETHLPPPPAAKVDRNTPDPAKRGYSAIQHVLRQFATELSSASLWVGMASQLRDALAELETAAQEARPVLTSIGEPIPATLLEAVRHACELLFAIGADSTRERFREKGSAADWPEVARNMISEIRTRLIAEERDGLLNEFAQAGVVPELTLFPFQDPKAVQWVTDRWAVWLDVNSWESIAGLVGLPDHLRLRLAFRVFVIPVVGQIALPLAAQQLGSEHFFPVGAEQIQACCTSAGKTPLVSPHLSAFRQFCDQIIEASRLASLHWLREAAWRSEETLRSARLQFDRAQESATRLPRGEIRGFADRTTAAVEAEIKAGGRPLAAAFHNLPPKPPDDAVLVQFNAMSWLVSANEATVPEL